MLPYETLRERFSPDVQFCTQVYSEDHPYHRSGKSCGLPVVPGTKYCYNHQPDGKRRLIDRLTEEQKNTAQQLFINGATNAVVGSRLGINASQAQRLKAQLPLAQAKKRGVPARIREREMDLEMIAWIKTERGWQRLYG